MAIKKNDHLMTTLFFILSDTFLYLERFLYSHVCDILIPMAIACWDAATDCDILR